MLGNRVDFSYFPVNRLEALVYNNWAFHLEQSEVKCIPTDNQYVNIKVNLE